MRESGEVHPERVGVPITARLWLMARRRVRAVIYSISFFFDADRKKKDDDAKE
jgi:hypothetical protein